MSDIVTPSTIIKTACSIGLASCLTGNDLFALIGAVAGVLLAMTKQEPVGMARASMGFISIVVLAVGATWFIAEALPAVVEHFGIKQFELVRGRVLVAYLIAYFAQSALLPGIGASLERFFSWIGKARS